jgi:hypothetical protein
MAMELNTELTIEGIECTSPVLGKVATIIRKLDDEELPECWYVMPYQFEPYNRGVKFVSLDAAEYYAVALACEMVHLGMKNRWNGHFWQAQPKEEKKSS